jgi:cobyric acid synthase
MAPEKTLVRTKARHTLSGLDVVGYEIHHGQTHANGCTPFLVADGGGIVGVSGDNPRVWGTYLHGVFDADAFRRWFIDRLRARRGWPPAEGDVASYDIEPALDRLAEVVRASLRIDDVYRIMGL